MSIAPDQATEMLNAAFGARGPTNPKVDFRIEGGVIVARATFLDRAGKTKAVREEPQPGLQGSGELGGHRYRAFVEGMAAAARQVAGGDPEELSFGAFLGPELLDVKEVGTADGFRRAVLDEGGVRTRVRATRFADGLARAVGRPVADEDGRELLFSVADPYSEGDFEEQCGQVRRLVQERPDLLAHLAEVVRRWAADPDAWWGEDETWSGPRLLGGLVKALLPGVPAASRAGLEQALAGFGGRVAPEDVLRAAEVL